MAEAATRSADALIAVVFLATATWGLLSLGPRFRERGELVRVGSARELEEGQRTVTTAGAHEILTVAAGGQIYAVGNRCSHSDGRLQLDNGFVYPETLELRCLWHAGRFSLVTGEATKRPCVLPIRTYEVVAQGDDVFVRMPGTG